MKFLIFINIVTVVLVTLKYQHYNDENKISISLENGEVYGIIKSRRTHRILAKYDNQKELMNSRFHYETKDNGDNHKLVNKTDNNNTYEMLKQAKPNNMEAYLSGYKNRHSKKRGLKKLDCYYENKFFSSLDKMEKIAKQKNINNNSIRSIVFRKYRFLLIFMCLLPLLTFAVPAIKVGRVHALGGENVVYTVQQKDKGDYSIKIDHSQCKFEPLVNNASQYIFFFITIIITASVIIYIGIKIKKYRRIKSGMLK